MTTRSVLVILVSAFAALVGMPGTMRAQAASAPNPSFELGADTPEGWRLNRGNGVWHTEGFEGDRSLSIVGDGRDTEANFWISDLIPFKPQTVYRLRFHARHIEGIGGSVFTGPMFNNRDLPEMTGDWQRFTSYFLTPPVIAPDDARLRFGQWNINGMAAFDAVELAEAIPVFRRHGEIELGAGEQIQDGQYTFIAPLAEESANHARPLEAFDCYFNKPRWVFAEGDWVVYRHQVGNLPQVNAQVEINIGYYSGGTLEIEGSIDGENWISLGDISRRGTLRMSLPKALLPAREVWVRLRAHRRSEAGQLPDRGGSLQVYGYQYSADLEGAPDNFTGATHFLTMTGKDDRVRIAYEDFGVCTQGENWMRLRMKNMTDGPLSLMPRIVAAAGGTRAETAAGEINIPAGVEEERTFAYTIPDIGEVSLIFLLDEDSNYQAESSFTLSSLAASDYGALLPVSSDEAALWWASSGWKVSRNRPLPQETAPAVRIQAARNEREAAQVVLRPTKPLRAVRGLPGALTGASGHVLSPTAIELCWVGYVSITVPTDSAGAAGLWPDPLPPMTDPRDLTAGENQPVWVRVAVPKDAPADIYSGVLTFEAEGWRAEVPLEVEVFDFTLPDRMTCQTAFGFDGHTAERYHGVSREEDRRTLAALYAEALSAHHISPYELGTNLIYPALTYSWPGLPPWEGGERILDDEARGGGAFRVRDDTIAATLSARYDVRFDVPDDGLRIALRYKTETPDHAFEIVLMHYDAEGNWIYGRNAQQVIVGDGSWQDVEVVQDHFPEEAEQFVLQINPTRYVEDGTTTGTVLIDVVHLSDAGTGAVLLADDFAPHAGEDLARITRPQFDWMSWDRDMQRVLDTYHFNSFVLRTPGLGWGAGWAAHDNVPGSLLGHAPGTPVYEAAFKAWYHEVQEHLRAKGWLDEAFIYWFDEPTPDQYDFVMKYNLMMKEAAPDLQRMLTEEIAPELLGGPNLWCPISYEYDHDAANARRAEGERIWWYICTGPKAPYATLFIDHPGTSLRVWLWQTWQRDIEGILIWAVNWWSSDAAYPEQAQNPYEDPMSWCHVLGDTVPVGAKHAWGNGDGRFLYPPLAAADGNPDAPVLEAPVGSIRLEMLRDGIEDYEYMVLLQALIEEQQQDLSEADLARYRRLLDTPPEITTSLTEFTWDPAPIEAHREAVARAIAALGQK